MLRPAGFSDEATVGIVYALLTYLLGFVALELPAPGPARRPATSSSAASTASSPPSPPGEFPHTVQLAPLLSRISTDDQFQAGITILIAGLKHHQLKSKLST